MQLLNNLVKRLSIILRRDQADANREFKTRLLIIAIWGSIPFFILKFASPGLTKHSEETRFLTILLIQVLTGILFYFTIFLHKQTKEILFPHREPIKHLTLIILAVCIATIAFMTCTKAYVSPLKYILIAVSAPILEEIYFRAVVLRLFALQVPYYLAIIVSSAIFAAGHDNPTHYIFAQYLIAGVILGSVYTITGRIWRVIILHSLMNNFVIFFPTMLF